MNQQNQPERYCELEEQILIMFVYQQLLDTKNQLKNYFITNINSFFTSANVSTSGLAVYELDEPVKTSNNNGLS